MTVHCEVPRLGCQRESQSVLVRGVSCVLRIPSLKKFVSCAHLTLVINRYVQQITIACNIFVPYRVNLGGGLKRDYVVAQQRD